MARSLRGKFKLIRGSGIEIAPTEMCLHKPCIAFRKKIKHSN
jgi:hypothetical protein